MPARLSLVPASTATFAGRRESVTPDQPGAAGSGDEDALAAEKDRQRSLTRIVHLPAGGVAQVHGRRRPRVVVVPPPGGPALGAAGDLADVEGLAGIGGLEAHV